MPDDNIESRITQFQRKLWSQNEIEQWYGIDISDGPTKSIMAQAALYGGPIGQESQYGSWEHFNHWHLEIFLQRRDLVPVRLAASRLAMSVEDFRIVISKVNECDEFLTIVRPMVGTGFVYRAFLLDFHRGFPELRRTVFGDQPTYIRMVHEEIASFLQVNVTTLRCDTSRVLGEPQVRPGNSCDCLTQEPIGIGFSVALDFKKPLELAPDVCSWLTYARHVDVLHKFAEPLPAKLTPDIILRLNQGHV